MAMKKWIKEEEEFLKENYLNMSYSAIGNKLGRTKMSVQKKAQDMKLVKEFKREYLPRPEVVSRELKARIKMEEFKIEKNTGDRIKVVIKSKLERNTRILKGKVIFKNNRFILMQTPNYKECVNLIDVYTGNVVIS